MGVVEQMKEVADFVKRYNDIDLNRRILSLETEVLDLSRDKRRAEERVEELEEALKYKGQLTFKESFFWRDGDPYPYCPACWDGKKALVHIVRGQIQNMGPQLQCPVCGHNYGRPTFPWPGRVANS
jgi:hypothetical protein